MKISKKTFCIYICTILITLLVLNTLYIYKIKNYGEIRQYNYYNTKNMKNDDRINLVLGAFTELFK
ncbi:MAG: hypothetical protein ACTTGJ_03140 [Clostridium sp.]